MFPGRHTRALADRRHRLRESNRHDRRGRPGSVCAWSSTVAAVGLLLWPAGGLAFPLESPRAALDPGGVDLLLGEPAERIRLDLGARSSAEAVATAQRAVFRGERSAVLPSDLSAVGTGGFDVLALVDGALPDLTPLFSELGASDPCPEAGPWPEDQHSCRIAAEVLVRRP